MISTDIIIIGGGATGVGILRDLSMRGIKCILLEQGGLANGTSSRFHGLLHSGARYAVNDNISAKECIDENVVIKRIGEQCVELTEGFFALTPKDDPDYIPLWLDGCKKASIPVEELDVKDALLLEPNLSKDILRVFRVPDSCIDGFRLVLQNAISARKYGGKFHTYSKVTGINVVSGAVKGVSAINTVTGERMEFACNYVINAGGSWSGEIASLAGLEVALSPDRGALLVFNHRFVSRVINRLHKSSDGDIFVPHGSVTLLGTTSADAKTPDDNKPTMDEVIKLLQIGENLLPNIHSYRVLRAFAGTRPLFGIKGAGRGASRNFNIVDHSLEGLEGLISVFGGKLTTYRLMAEKVADMAAKKLGNNKKCRTADESIVPKVTKETFERAKKFFPSQAVGIVADRIGADLEKIVDTIEQTSENNEVICECEMVTLGEIKYVASDPETYYLNDVRLRTRLGMGTCQGTFCSLRAIAALEKEFHHTPLTPAENVKSFLQERWSGLRPVLWGAQMVEIELSRAIYLSTLNFNGGYDEA